MDTSSVPFCIHIVRASVSTAIAQVLMVAGALAQTPPSTAPEVSVLEEVVVTANRRAENSQKVPIAVTAITAESATAVGITDMQSLANAVPGLRIDRATSTALPYIRGVGSPAGQVSNEPPVAIYVDDIYMPAAGAALANFSSVAGIEVAKGPQGTLFGRNATGGVVQVFTKNPSSEPSMDVSVGYANYNTFSGSVYATGGLTDTLKANISLYGGDQGKGWGDNVTTGDDAFDLNRYIGGRIKLLWEPSDATSVLLTVDYDKTKSGQGYYRPVEGTIGAGFYPAPPDYYDLVDHTDPHWQVEQAGVSAKITHDFTQTRLVSISAYRDTTQDQYFDQSGGPIPLVIVDLSGPTKTFTQEFQLLSPEDSKVSWIGGLFYMADESGYQPLRLSGLAFSAQGLDFLSSHSEQKTKSYAAFAQATLPIFEKTRLTLGARYTRDERDMAVTQQIQVTGFGDVGGKLDSRSKTFSKPSGRASLDYQFTDDIMGYVSYNRGFKSGTFNAVVTGPAIGDAVKPETLDDYSVGAKSEFFDHRLRVNTEAFYYKYKNIQATRIVPGGTALSNAAKATIKGIDVDITAMPTEGLTLTAAFELLDGEYDDFPEGVFWDYAPISFGISNIAREPGPNLEGYDTVYTPPFSASLRATYTHETPMGTWDFNVGYNHTGDYFFDPDNGKGQLKDSHDKQPKLDLVDASIGWASPSGMYDVRLWGKNITGEEYVSFGFEEALLTQIAPAPPATYGITFGMHFE
ncbi:MAG: TonB-dependent receptor [Steroidobacteraceae bacterium]